MGGEFNSTLAPLITQFVDLLQLRSAKWQRWDRLLSGRYRPFAVGGDRPLSCSPIESLNCRLTTNTHSIGIGVAAQSRINRGLSPIVPIVSGSACPRLVSSGLARIEPEQLLLETVGPHHAVGVAVARYVTKVRIQFGVVERVDAGVRNRRQYRGGKCLA